MVLIPGRIGSAWPRVLLGLSGLLFAGFSLSCMSFSFGGRTQVVSPTPQDSQAAGEGLQRGTAYVPRGQEVRVYYPIPYVSNPNLEFEDSDGKRHLQIVDQKPDHVRVRNTSSSDCEVPWKTRGVLVTTAKTPDTSTAVQATMSTARDQQNLVQPRVP
jgi:hypothetical protein